MKTVTAYECKAKINDDVATSIERERLLAEVWLKANQEGRAGEEWAKIAMFLEKTFSKSASLGSGK